MRAAYSKKHYEYYREESNTSQSNIIDTTLFGDFVLSGDIDEKEIEKFSYSVFITDRILENLYKDLETIEDVFFISKIVEHGYFKLVKDFDSFSLKNNLSVSKEFGVFFTPLVVSREMAKQAVEESQTKVIIDPCCGTGNLLAACMEYAAENTIELNKLIGIELDAYSAEVCKKTLELYGHKLKIDVDIEIINSDSLEMLSRQSSLFGRELQIGTFIINPPYGKLKFDSDHMSNIETKLTYNNDHLEKKRLGKIKAQSKVKRALNGLNAGKGTPEWSKVFLALCLDRIHDGEGMVFIGPCGWLNSISQSAIRKGIIEKKMLKKVHFLSEAVTGFETVNQPLAIITANASGQLNYVDISNDFDQSKKFYYRDFEKLSKYNYPIPRISADKLKLFIRLQEFPKLSNCEEINNLRGELDQSINKSLFTKKRTKLEVIRGKNIGRYLYIKNDKRLFVDEKLFKEQIGVKPKGNAHKSPRIVGRQCSYMKQKRRLVFDIVSPNCVVGNSCNYLMVKNESDLPFYLALLNSAVMDWYFRVLNGNNHVANYEIDDFPIPYVTEKLKNNIVKEATRIKAVRQTHADAMASTYIDEECKLEAMIFDAYGLSKKEVAIVLENHDFKYIKKATSLYK